MPLLPGLRTEVPPGPLTPQVQAFLAIEPVGPFVVHAPAFTPRKHVDALVAIAHAHCCDLFDVRCQWRLIFCLGLVADA